MVKDQDASVPLKKVLRKMTKLEETDILKILYSKIFSNHRFKLYIFTPLLRKIQDKTF